MWLFVIILERAFYFVKETTVCVSGRRVRTNFGEQRKLEAWKMLENGADSPPSTARFVGQPLWTRDTLIEKTPLPTDLFFTILTLCLPFQLTLSKAVAILPSL